MTRTDKVDLEAKRDSENRFALGALFEFSSIVNSSLDLKFILGHFLLTLMGKLLSRRGVVLLGRDPGHFAIENVKGLPPELVGSEIAIPRFPRQLLYTDHKENPKNAWIRVFRDNGIRLLVPLAARDKPVGIAGFAPGMLKKKLSEREATYVKSLANIAAEAIEKGIVINELSRVNRRLDGKIQEMNTLFELSKEFNAILDPDRLVRLLTFSVMGQVGASRYAICLEREGAMSVVASKLDGELSADLRRYFSTVSAPLLVESLARKVDRKWQQPLTDLGIELLVPLQSQNKTIGMLALGARLRGDKYTPTDVEFIFSLGNLAIISLENARLFHDALEKQKMEDELLIAREIQKGLLPAKLPAIECFDVAATNLSSKQVGGDYYDVIPIGGSKFVIAIGDVSGKGTPASLLMANLQATIRALVPLGLPLAELTRRVNDLICDNTGNDRFITFFWGILDSAARTLNYVSAGHNPPFLFRAGGGVERLDKGGIILGIMKAVVPYQEGIVNIAAGDVLVLFTDGVSEAMNSAGEEWGEENLERVSKGSLHERPAVIMDRIVEAVREHSRDTQQSDDITLVVAKAIG